MMTAAMDMMQVESRINGVNEALTIAGAPFHVSPISVPKANVGEIPGFSTKAIPEDGLMHPIVYWDPKFEKLTDMDLAKHIIQSYIDGMREEVPAFSDILTHDYLLGHVLPRVLSRDSNESLLQERSIPYALLPDTDLLATFYIPVAEVDGNVQVNRSVAEVAGVTTEELLESAATNVLESMTVKPLLQVMHEITGTPYDPDTDDDGLSLFVVSNDSAMYGAGVLAAGREAYCRMAEAARTDPGTPAQAPAPQTRNPPSWPGTRSMASATSRQHSAPRWPSGSVHPCPQSRLRCTRSGLRPRCIPMSLRQGSATATDDGPGTAGG